MLTNDIKNLRLKLKEVKVATIVCSRLPLLENKGKLLKFMSDDDINVHPPLLSQNIENLFSLRIDVEILFSLRIDE